MRLFDLLMACLCATMPVVLVSLASVCGQDGLGVDQWQTREEVMYYPIYVENSKDREVHEWFSGLLTVLMLPLCSLFKGFTKLLTGITLTLVITTFLTKSGGNVETFHESGMESMNGGIPPPS